MKDPQSCLNKMRKIAADHTRNGLDRVAWIDDGGDYLVNVKYVSAKFVWRKVKCDNRSWIITEKEALELLSGMSERSASSVAA